MLTYHVFFLCVGKYGNWAEPRVALADAFRQKSQRLATYQAQHEPSEDSEEAMLEVIEECVSLLDDATQQCKAALEVGGCTPWSVPGYGRIYYSCGNACTRGLLVCPELEET